MKYKIIRIVPRLLQPVLSYCHPSLSRGILCFQWRSSGNCFVCWYSCPGLRCINVVHADYCIQISHQRYISPVIHTAFLNNVRKVGRLVLSRTSCLLLSVSGLRAGWNYIAGRRLPTPALDHPVVIKILWQVSHLHLTEKSVVFAAFLGIQACSAMRLQM
jgi:hypothetical protein